MQGVPEKLVALAAQVNAMNLARLEADRSSAGQALQRLRVGKERAVVADLSQEPRGDLLTGAGE